MTVAVRMDMGLTDAQAISDRLLQTRGTPTGAELTDQLWLVAVFVEQRRRTRITERPDFTARANGILARLDPQPGEHPVTPTKQPPTRHRKKPAKPRLGDRQRELLKYTLDLDGTLSGYHADRLAHRPGWTRTTVGNASLSLREKGLLTKAAPDLQPLYPLKLTRAGKALALELFPPPARRR